VQARTGQRMDWQPTDRDPATLPPRVTELLGHPLTSDAAVEIALANSPRLRSTLQELRIAESDLVRAGTLPNPRFSFTNIAGGGIREIERTLMVELTALFMMPLALDLEQRRFELTQLRVASELVAAIAEVRTAYVRAVASLELLPGPVAIERDWCESRPDRPRTVLEGERDQDEREQRRDQRSTIDPRVEHAR